MLERLSESNNKVALISPLEFDFSNSEDIKNVFQERVNQLGYVDCIINLQGLTNIVSINSDMTTEEWESTVLSLYNGLFYSSKISYEFLKNHTNSAYFGVTNIGKYFGVENNQNEVINSSPLVAVEVYEKQEGGSIGIDIEKIFKNISSEFLEYCFTSKELESISKIFKQTTFECSCTMLWCIKESVGKLFSIGLSGNPKKIEILFKNLNELEVVIHSNKLGACVYREPLSLNVDFLDGYCICSAKIRGGIDNDINYISKKFKEDLSTKDSC